MAPRGGDSDSEEDEERWSAKARLRWSFRRLVYGVDSAASSPAWQTLARRPARTIAAYGVADHSLAAQGLLGLALVIVAASGRAVMGTGNHLHANYDRDTSLSVRCQFRCEQRSSCCGRFMTP
jgi:hypothetical protein